MDIKSLLKLTSAGYSLTEIKDMPDRDTVIELISGGVSRDDVPEYIEILKAQEKPKEKEKEEDPEEKSEDDYKSKYEELLKEKQEQERRKPLPDKGERTAEKILEEFAKTL